MTNKQILQADLLDILFENRNKAYGAYALRKTYASRLKWAVGISLSFSMLLLFFSFSGSKNEDPSVDKTKGMELSVLALAPNEPRKPGGSPKPRIKPQVAQTSFVNRIRLVANNVQPSVPSIKDLESTIISDVNAKGVQPGDIPESSNNRRVGNGVDEK